jgi:predicted NACHT family NTPase
MAEQLYDWKRFWCPRSSQINLGDRGYLTDPESKYGKYANPDLVGLEAIADIPCLVLLGEPGIGKSQELINLKNHTAKNLDSDNKILELNLRSCTSLKEDLFKDEQFITWEKGTHCLYLFLDSLDEGLLQTQNIATQLVDTFTKDQYRDKLSCLYLRIACRTAVFPNILEEGLKKLWKESNVGIYELAPLRRIDVQASVKAHSLDADDFLNEVERKGVVPFAVKPITLKFLLNIFQKHHGQFPPEQKLVDLYLAGCKALCEEQNSSRRASKRTGKLKVEQRLIVAARIAVVTIFANRFAVWTETDLGDVPTEDVLLEELCGNEARDTIEEVLDTGLFSSRGFSRMGWAHQTYAGFLAAWYLTQRNFEPNQILTLIIHPDHRVVPQLQETATWLASMIPEVFQEVLKTDPDILLQSDIAKASDIDKARLVESLLQAYDENKLPYAPFRFWQYQHLNHTELPNQLREYINSINKNTLSRLTAINIAEACNINSIQESLIDVALNSQDDYQVRVHAISAVSKLCDEDTKLRLKPLAIGDIEYDPDDDLKGYALQAAYPTQVSTEEVLKSLKSPNSRSIGGSYQEFLATIFAEHLQPNDLLTALNWLEKQLTVGELDHPFDKLSDSILLKAWEYIEDSTVLSAFARVVLTRIENSSAIIRSDYSEFKQQISENHNKRRKLIDAVISIMSDSDQDTWFSFCDSQYDQLTLQEVDCLWLSEQLAASESEPIRNIYKNLIRQQSYCTTNQVQRVAGFCPKIKVNGFDHSADNFDLSEIWNFVDKDNLDREVFELIEYCLNHNIEIKQHLTENHLAKLYIFLEREYLEKQESNNKSDKKSTLNGVVWRLKRPVDALKDYDFILQWIQERGTSKACEALRTIIRELPELADDLQWRLLETEAAARRNAWNPLQPKEILRFTLTQAPSTSDLLAPINEINQRTKQMAEQPNVTISGGTFNGPINFASNQGSQPTTIIDIQNNYFNFNTDEALRKEIADLNRFIAELDAKHPNIQTETDAEQILDAEILAVQTDNPTRWQSLRHQMSLLKRQLLNPERHLQAAKATLIEVTKTAYEKSLIVKAIITYIDKLSEEPNHGA